MNFHHYFGTLARYHVWATEKVLAEIEPISDHHYRQDCGLFFKSIHGTLNHMLVGETAWYARFAEGVSLKLQLNAELEQDRQGVIAALREAVKRWGDWIPAIETGRFDGKLQYNRASGEQVIVPYASALGHVFNHGTHHRGQLSAALTAMHYKVPEMDLIYMLQAEMKS